MKCVKCGKELKEVFWSGGKPYGPKCFTALTKSQAVRCEQEDLFKPRSEDGKR
jgi:DNA-directed RNA polymerase subunit RPC12/RpoP